MKFLAILTCAVLCHVSDVYSATTGTMAPVTQAAATQSANTGSGSGNQAATTAGDVTVNISLTFGGTWNAMYSNMSHPDTMNTTDAICAAVVASVALVKGCTVDQLRSGSITADLTVTASGGTTAAAIKTSVDSASAKTAIKASMVNAGIDLGDITAVVDNTSGSSTTTTTAAPGNAATTLGTSLIMYATVLCVTVKAVLF